MQATAILKTTLATETPRGDWFVFPIPAPHSSADFAAGQTVYLEVYARVFSGLAVNVTGVTYLAVNWPLNAPYPLPPGTYNCEFQTTEGGSLPADVSQVAPQAPVVLVAQEVDPATVDLEGLATAYNGVVAAHDELATAYNGLLTAMQTAGLMVTITRVATEAPTKTSKKAKK